MDDRELLAVLAAIVFRGCLSPETGLEFEADHALKVAQAILKSVDHFLAKRRSEKHEPNKA
jgi:hypothetical protein